MKLSSGEGSDQSTKTTMSANTFVPLPTMTQHGKDPLMISNERSECGSKNPNDEGTFNNIEVENGVMSHQPAN